MFCTGSIVWDLLGVLTALLAITYAYFKWTYQYWARKNVPYFEPKIPLGNLTNLSSLLLGQSIVPFYNKAKANGWKYFGIYNVLSPVLLVLDLDLVKHVLAKDFQHFTDRGIYTNEKNEPMRSHLFNIGGRKWRNLRAKLTPTFTSGKLKSMFQTLADCGLVLEKYIEENITPGQPVDIKNILACFSTDVIGSCAFGLDCNSFKEPDSLFRYYGNKIFMVDKARAFKITLSQVFPALVTFFGIQLSPKGTSDFFTKVVKDTVSYREKNNVVRKDFLQLLIEIRSTKDGQEDGYGGDGNTLTMEEMVAQSFVFFAAGFETSSTTMTFALFELATHPEIQDRLREEIKSVLAKHDDKITYDALSEMKYLGQVIDEALRLHSPAKFLQRKCVSDYKIPGEDIIIEKGTMLFIPILGIHLDEEYWDNPQEFNPDRFSEDNKKYMNQYSHLPFGQGPRACIGERFGVMQVKVGLSCLLRKFRVKVDKKTQLPLKMSSKELVSSAEGGIWLNLEKI